MAWSGIFSGFLIHSCSERNNYSILSTQIELAVNGGGTTATNSWRLLLTDPEALKSWEIRPIST
jgi:hypothetical protein